jgi:hypothetical protein
LALGGLALALRGLLGENATAVIWKMLPLAEQRFHQLDALEKLMQVYLEFASQP